MSHTQVKGYMPMSYWAGRFQSRFDQWRTDAMAHELHICKNKPKSLGSYELNQEDKAACLIFLQLRGLCASSQAADSLWVSPEYLKGNNSISLDRANTP